jgi:hypothetical protein
MGLLLAFAVGYVVGARAGSQGLDDVKEALKGIASSEELDSLIAAVRSHAGHTLRELETRLSSSEAREGSSSGTHSGALTVEALIDRVRKLVGGSDESVTSSAS